MTDIVSLSDKVSKFNEQVNRHLESQSLNPFSGRYNSRSPSPRPCFAKEEYGRPVAGSKTEERGRRAKTHIHREIVELCTVITDMASHNAKLEGLPEPDGSDDAPIIVSFGELFQVYSNISDKLVGLLMQAKKKKFLYFEPEILFQRRDDEEPIALTMTLEEISAILQPADTPAPEAIPDPEVAPSSDKGEQTLA